MVSVGRAVIRDASRSLIEFPVTNQTGFISRKFAVHVILYLFLRPDHIPDSDFVHRPVKAPLEAPA